MGGRERCVPATEMGGGTAGVEEPIFFSGEYASEAKVLLGGDLGVGVPEFPVPAGW